MNRNPWIILIGVAALIVVLWIGVRSALRRVMIAALPIPSPAQMYPDAPPMPAVVAEPPDVLLARFEGMLAQQAPQVLASLQPGLSDAQIDALEAKHQFKLTPDLRALYRWRNGSARDAKLAVFAEHRFAPLEEAIAKRDALRQQRQSAPADQRKLDDALIGHRDAWLGLIEDAAGDGYFFDPVRSEAQGSFFFCFAEDTTYVFFPAFRNFLAATIAGHESGALKFGPRGAETKDFGEAQKLWLRFGAPNPR